MARTIRNKAEINMAASFWSMTPQTVTDLLNSAKQVAQEAASKAENSSIGEKIKNGLYNSSVQIQGFINDILESKGLVTQEKVDALNKKMAETKLRILEAKNNETKKKYLIIAGVSLATVGVLWYVLKK